MEGARVLVVSYRRDLLIRRAERLRQAGYSVDTAGDQRQAEFLLRHNSYDVAVLGIAVPEEARNRLAKALDQFTPGCAVIMLYECSIRNTELADAVLNSESAETDLADAIGHLLAHRSEDHARRAAQ